jgi:hypothetical protein
MDLDAVLARHPALVLVDELAHRNAPGSRHERRWQDVMELLDAGIDVWTTVNIQHLESLNDVVMRITGVRVSETVPDGVLDRLHDIVLVDPAAARTDRAPAAGQGLCARTGRAGAAGVLLAGQPDRPARAGDAGSRRPRRQQPA